jgi:hypothetical protein
VVWVNEMHHIDMRIACQVIIANNFMNHDTVTIYTYDNDVVC